MFLVPLAAQEKSLSTPILQYLFEDRNFDLKPEPRCSTGFVPTKFSGKPMTGLERDVKVATPVTLKHARNRCHFHRLLRALFR